MRLDFTRFDCFWRNPEMYRIKYECNLVPTTASYGLQRGTAFHTIKDCHHAGMDKASIETHLASIVPDLKARAMAWKMWHEWQLRYNPHGPTILASELEFEVPIIGSPHTIVGRLDEVIEVGGVQWVGEVKTANNKATLAKLQERFALDRQVDFVLVGAQHAGYQPLGVLVRAIIETNPPRIWEIPVKRPAHALDLLRLNVHQTCEMVGFMRDHFGIDQPWPHLEKSWPCMAKGKCEMEQLCRRPTNEWTPQDLEGYQRRTEHLTILQTA